MKLSLLNNSKVVSSYEEGEVDHINGPTHPPTQSGKYGVMYQKRIRRWRLRKWKHVATQKPIRVCTVGTLYQIDHTHGCGFNVILSRKSSQTLLIWSTSPFPYNSEYNHFMVWAIQGENEAAVLKGQRSLKPFGTELNEAI